MNRTSSSRNHFLIPALILGVGLLAAFFGCMKPGDGIGLDSQGKPLPLPPQIAFTGPVVDTIGVAATHAPVLGGGAITGISVTPNLPAGLNLNATTGIISGSPLTASPAADYSVVAAGPGGSATATINITVVDPCVLNPNLPACNAKPEFSYAASVTDTVGKAASHVPAITGRVSSFVLAGGTLPAGLALDAASGQISGTPSAVAAAGDVTIVASGPGGSDTASITLTVVDDPCLINPGAPGCGLPANYFANNILPIFSANCEVCHNPTGTCYGQTQLSLRAADAYNLLVNHASTTLDFTGYPVELKRILPGKPDSSYLYRKITKTTAELSDPDSGWGGARMPLNVAQPLSQSDIDKIKLWIEAGAPRN